MIISFGDRLRIARLQNGLKQDELAESVGLKAAAISKYEKNVASPNIETLREICCTLNVTADWLLGIEREIGNAGSNNLYDAINELDEPYKSRVIGYMEAMIEASKQSQLE